MLPPAALQTIVSETELFTVAGLPLHPLVVHAVAVLSPAAALLFIAVVLRPTWRAHYAAPIVFISWLAALSAVVAVLAGNQLAAIEGVTEQHERSGRLLAITASALAVTATLWLWRERKHSSNFTNTAATHDSLAKAASWIGVGLSAVVLPLVVISGHSGAASVWTSVTAKANAEADPEASTTSFTIAEVATNNSIESCWSVVDGRVFDLTDWIAQHPGGPEAVLAMCGTDSTEIFEVQHGLSGEPAEILSSYQIGVLAD